MKVLLKAVLEVIRIIILIFVLGAVFWAPLNYVYHLLGFDFTDNNQYILLLWIPILIFIFIIYKNFLSSFKENNKKEKLSRKTVLFFLMIAFFLLIIIPFI